MTARIRWIAALGLCCVAVGTATAQDRLPDAGADVLTTDRAPNTTAVGRTKPPSRDASPTSVRDIDRPTARQVADDAISSSVCVGCKPDPSATGSLPTEAASHKPDVRLDELRALAPPAQQSDLNTGELASAHRERAKSMEQKTDGLWQSWLVSVCDGCGDQKPARAQRYEDWPDRTTPLPTNVPGAGRAGRESGTMTVAARPSGRLEADLSPANVDTIRRPPQR